MAEENKPSAPAAAPTGTIPSTGAGAVALMGAGSGGAAGPLHADPPTAAARNQAIARIRTDRPPVSGAG